MWKSDKIHTLFAALGSFLYLIFLLVFFLFIPNSIINSDTQIFPFDIGVFRFIGTIPIFIGTLIVLWSTWSLTFLGKGTPLLFYPTEELVVKGLYRYVRNPFYVGAICIFIGEAILFESTYLFLYTIGFFVFFNLLIVSEEVILKQSFGESYEKYCKSVSRWIPRLNDFRGDDTSKSS